MAKRILRFSVSFIVAIALCLGCLPFVQRLTGVADNPEKFSASINGFPKMDGEDLKSIIAKANLGAAPLTAIDVKSGKISQADFELLKNENANATLNSLTLHGAPPLISSISAFVGCPQNRSVYVPEDLAIDYKNVDDQNTVDNLWYGWNICPVKTNKATIAEEDANNAITQSTGESIVIVPNSANVALGATQEFIANVYKEGNIVSDKTFTWSITGNTSDKTQINQAGSLVVGQNESAQTIAVKAVCGELKTTINIAIDNPNLIVNSPPATNDALGTPVPTASNPSNPSTPSTPSISQAEKDAEKVRVTNEYVTAEKQKYTGFFANNLGEEYVGEACEVKDGATLTLFARIQYKADANTKPIDKTASTYSWSKLGAPLLDTNGQPFVKATYTKVFNSKVDQSEYAVSAAIPLAATLTTKYGDTVTVNETFDLILRCKVTLPNTKGIDLTFGRTEMIRVDQTGKAVTDDEIKQQYKGNPTGLDTAQKRYKVTTSVSKAKFTGQSGSKEEIDYNNCNKEKIEGQFVIYLNDRQYATVETTTSGVDVEGNKPFSVIIDSDEIGNVKINVSFIPSNIYYHSNGYEDRRYFADLRQPNLLTSPDITAITIASPVTDEIAQTSAISGNNYKAKIFWTIGESPIKDKFYAGKSHTAHVVLTADSGYAFATDAIPTIISSGGVQIGSPEVTVALNAAGTAKEPFSGNTLTVKIKFPQTKNPKKQDQEPLDFATKIPNKLNYGAIPFALAVKGGSGDGKVTFTSDNPKVLQIKNAADGTAIATLIGAGKTTITATKAAGSFTDVNDNTITNYNSQSIKSDEIIVSPRVLIARATDATVKVGTKVTYLPVKVTGFVNGDTEDNLDGYVAPTATSAGIIPPKTGTSSGSSGSGSSGSSGSSGTPAKADDSALLGDFDIIVSGGTPTSAYKFKYVSAVLTVSKTGEEVPSESETLENPATIIENLKSGVSVQTLDKTEFETGTTLEVTNKTLTLDSKDRVKYDANIAKAAGGRKMIELYDITMKLNGEKYQPKNKLNVSINLSDTVKQKYRNLAIVYIDDNANVTIIPHGISTEQISFQTNHFSKYAIIGDTANVSTNPATGDNTTTGLVIGLCLIPLMIVIIRRNKKPQDKE